MTYIPNYSKGVLNYIRFGYIKSVTDSLPILVKIEDKEIF